jgi:hypothetical protein
MATYELIFTLQVIEQELQWLKNKKLGVSVVRNSGYSQNGGIMDIAYNINPLSSQPSSLAWFTR